MKAGYKNTVIRDNCVVHSTKEYQPGFEIENLFDDLVRKIWKVNDGDVTLSVTFDTPITADFIGLYNVQFGDDIRIRTYNSSAAVTNEATLDHTDEGGILYEADGVTAWKNRTLSFEFDARTSDIAELEFLFSGDSSDVSSIGYIWAGLLVDFERLEKIQPADVSADEVQMTRENHPQVKPNYITQKFSMTLHKNQTFTTLSGKIRQIIGTGWGTPRPWLMDEPLFDVPFSILGIMDSGQIKYDIFAKAGKTSDEYLSQTTIGIQEVF